MPELSPLDVTPSADRSRIMAAVGRRDTAPEMRLRRALHASGYRYRVDYPIKVVGRPVRADIAFTKARVAVFVDGCFWHMCPQHSTMPATNAAFWRQKLETNAARDSRQTGLLIDTGWVVLRIWEHESVSDAFTTVRKALESRRGTPPHSGAAPLSSRKF